MTESRSEDKEHMIEREELTHLSVPAEPKYARVVRMLAANLATIKGFSIEDVEDVRMAAEEAFVYACATETGDMVDMDFSLADEAFTMVFPLGNAEVSDDAEEPAMTYAAFILDAVCDSYEMTDSTLTLVKRFGGIDAV